MGCGNLYLRPAGAFMKNAIALRRLTRNFLYIWERWRKGGQEDAPLGLPPRWGREGVTLITF
jgi:hypothetical protein